MTWASVGREHDIAYSHSNNLTDRYAADKVLADKALGRVTARDSALRESLLLFAQDQDWHEHEAEERGDNEEKDNEKTDIIDGETRQHVTFSANIRHTQILDWRRGQRNEGGKR